MTLTLSPLYNVNYMQITYFSYLGLGNTAWIHGLFIDVSSPSCSVLPVPPSVSFLAVHFLSLFFLLLFFLLPPQVSPVFKFVSCPFVSFLFLVLFLVLPCTCKFGLLFLKSLLWTWSSGCASKWVLKFLMFFQTRTQYTYASNGHSIRFLFQKAASLCYIAGNFTAAVHLAHLWVHAGMKTPQPLSTPRAWTLMCSGAKYGWVCCFSPHSFWRFVLSIRHPVFSGSQCFHESSVRCSIIQPASTLEMVMDGWEGRDAGEKPQFGVKFVAVDT